MTMISAREALDNLQVGNGRFVSGDRIRGSHSQQEFRAELHAEQTPFAVVLGCSDSRVPAEIVFDQGLGDLFVIRVAGNIVAPSQIGSVEFAVQHLGARLVVVLGHSRCGAVEATIEQLRQPAENQSENLRFIVDRIKPAVNAAMASHTGSDREQLLHHAVRENIDNAVKQLQSGSDILEQLIRDEGLMVVGAEYSLETRRVHFFDGTSKDT